jgi:hypothetical protein
MIRLIFKEPSRGSWLSTPKIDGKQASLHINLAVVLDIRKQLEAWRFYIFHRIIEQRLKSFGMSPVHSLLPIYKILVHLPFCPTSPYQKIPRLPILSVNSFLIRIKAPSSRLRHIPRTRTAQKIKRLGLEAALLLLWRRPLVNHRDSVLAFAERPVGGHGLADHFLHLAAPQTLGLVLHRQAADAGRRFDRLERFCRGHVRSHGEGGRAVNESVPGAEALFSLGDVGAQVVLEGLRAVFGVGVCVVHDGGDGGE